SRSGKNGNPWKTSSVSQKEEVMFTKRDKVKSTAFSDFVRHMSSRDKKKFFDKVVRETIKEQQEMIAKADQRTCCQ
ncbi:MAG: hypothetical protein ACRDD9_01455, partial [Shewanella sp.]